MISLEEFHDIKVRKIKIENFKIFNKKTDFDLAPITLLTGPNNSGKSSLTKAYASLLYSLKEDVFQGIDLNNPFIPLGKYELIKNNKSTDPFIKLHLNLIGEGSELPLEIIFTYCVSKFISTFAVLDKLEFVFEDKVLFVFADMLGSGNMYEATINVETSINYLNKIRNKNSFKLHNLLQKYQLQIGNIPQTIQGRRVINDFHESFTDQVIDFLSSFEPDKNSLIRKYKIDKGVLVEMLEPHLKGIKNSDDFNEFLFCFEDLIRKIYKLISENIKRIRQTANHFKYSPINRGGIKSPFQYNSQTTLIERTINSLYIKNINFRDPDDNLLYQSDIREEVLIWLNHFSIGKEIEIKDIDGVNYNVYLKKYDNESIPLYELGFGISGLISLMLSLIGRDNEINIIEEPETNLHPAFQSKLADLFAKNIKKQLLIETHSEYMIRKFQYLVAQKELKPDDIIIYYFHDPNNIPKGEKHIKKITIREDGRLSEPFGSGFFDETDKLLNGLISGNKI